MSPPPRKANLFGGTREQRPGAFDSKLLAFAEDLRSEGVAIGTSELLDAFEALGHVHWTAQTEFREALAATLAKSQEDRRIFELVFERFFFRAAEAEASRRGVAESHTGGEATQIDLDTLREQIALALRDGSDASLRDLARLAISAFAGSGRGQWRRTGRSRGSGRPSARPRARPAVPPPPGSLRPPPATAATPDVNPAP